MGALFDSNFAKDVQLAKFYLFHAGQPAKHDRLTNNRLMPKHKLDTAQLHHPVGVRHAKLTIACRWKSDPAKAVAGGLGPSLAGVVATRGPKCRQGPCRVRDRASKGGGTRRPSWFPNSEGSMCAVGRRDGVAPPGSKAGSCTIPSDWSPAGDAREALPELASEPRSGVGPVHSTDEAVEGNETRGGKGPA